MPLARRTLLGAAALLAAPSVQAQNGWPGRPVRLIVPWPPGGGVDVLARVLQPALAARLGQTVVVENIGGGSGRLGTQAAARATPDGYTILLANDTFAATEALPLPGAPRRRTALTPVTLAISAPQGFFAHPRSGIATIEDFASAARARPGALNVGITGIGTSQHFVSELLLRAAGGLRVEHVPYRGGGPLLADLAAGTIDVGVVTFAAAVGQARAGQLVPLAVTTATRTPDFPDVPTAAETIAPGFAQTTWQGLFAPAGTPETVLARLHEAAAGALADPAVTERLGPLGFEPVGADGAAFGRLLDETIATFADIALARGIVPTG